MGVLRIKLAKKVVEPTYAGIIREILGIKIEVWVLLFKCTKIKLILKVFECNKNEKKEPL